MADEQQDDQQQQQNKLDAILVPIDEQVNIRLSNFRIALEKTQPNVIYKVCLGILQYAKAYIFTLNDQNFDVNADLLTFSDADWAKCVITRKSVTGYYVFLNDSLVFWKRKKQNTLSKSSTEAEYISLASVTSEVETKGGCLAVSNGCCKDGRPFLLFADSHMLGQGL
ncbi:ribonuclease H-like domain-containing protein [Tanacetum coccineum]|uniref:Ribonuclease H-like domain-containing protein n=1 Tax=Tanacetum coccineum TaxID=301880 RepID=A0ABQ5F9T2_9ASTR